MSMACYGCSALEEVVIPEGTTKIGGQAFYECRALTDVYCRAGVPPLLGIQVFEGTSIKNLYVPEGSADAYREAEGGVCLNISRAGVMIAERPKRKNGRTAFWVSCRFCEICRRTSVLCEGKTDRVGKTLFHRPDADFRYVGQFRRVGRCRFLFDFAVMIGVEDRGTDRLDCIHGLIDRHRVGLIDGQEGDVDAMQGFHFGCIFPVSGDVDACTSDSQDVTAILSFAGVELLTVFGGVVGRNSFDREVVARGERIARLHRQALASQRFAAGPVAHDGCGCGGESGDGRAVRWS